MSAISVAATASELSTNDPYEVIDLTFTYGGTTTQGGSTIYYGATLSDGTHSEDVLFPFGVTSGTNIPASEAFAYTPAVLHVNPGDKVTIELASTDVVHGIFVDGYNVHVTADPGQPARLSFIADRPGTFRLRCSVTCGALHPFMTGKLQVGSNLLLWRSMGLAVLAFLGIFIARAPQKNLPVTNYQL